MLQVVLGGAEVDGGMVSGVSGVSGVASGQPLVGRIGVSRSRRRGGHRWHVIGVVTPGGGVVVMLSLVDGCRRMNGLLVRFVVIEMSGGVVCVVIVARVPGVVHLVAVGLRVVLWVVIIVCRLALDCHVTQ